jgi:hypothetical protein
MPRYDVRNSYWQSEHRLFFYTNREFQDYNLGGLRFPGFVCPIRDNCKSILALLQSDFIKKFPEISNDSIFEGLEFSKKIIFFIFFEILKNFDFFDYLTAG